jgi:exodeoxyribonuclease VII large subunit
VSFFTVSDLSTYLRETLDNDPILSDLWVQGEVSNLSRPVSGHLYFTLKDQQAQIRSACWKSSVARLHTMPHNGDAVLVHGHVSFYEAGGQLQLYVDDIRPAGVGLLHARYEELKARLEAEGLFDPSRKRPLPEFPRRIGIATSQTGAALQDMLNVLRRRFPLVEVVLAPCQVQGEGSVESVIRALTALYTLGDLDVIIVARGGGSIEDLWTFNEEAVARAAFASPAPLISGVGHETDTTILDLVADLRAATPTAAAELATPDLAELFDALKGLVSHLHTAAAAHLTERRALLLDLGHRLERRSPEMRLDRARQMADDLLHRATTRIDGMLQLRQARLGGVQARLASLSPLATLQRGYAVVRRNDTRAIVTDPLQVPPGVLLHVTVRDGTFLARGESSDEPDFEYS